MEGLFEPHMINRTSYCVFYDNYVQDSSADVSPFKENLPTREEERNYTTRFFLEMLLNECIIILHKEHETDKIQGEGRHQRRQELTPLQRRRNINLSFLVKATSITLYKNNNKTILLNNKFSMYSCSIL